MAQNRVAPPFADTPEQAERLAQIIRAQQGKRGALMSVLQQAQGVYGYLPREVQERVAQGLGLTLAEVYGVVTFYAQFSLYPKGQHQINICLGTACYVKGADKILALFERRLGITVGELTPDGRFSLEATRCIGACGLAPVCVVKTGDHEDVFGRMVDSDVDKILAKYSGA